MPRGRGFDPRLALQKETDQGAVGPLAALRVEAAARGSSGGVEGGGGDAALSGDLAEAEDVEAMPGQQGEREDVSIGALIGSAQ